VAAPEISPVLDTKWLTVAHEVAMNIRDIDDILLGQGISLREWERMQEDPKFQSLLSSKIIEWNGAGNTQQRVKMKAAAMVELNMDQLHLALNDEEVTAPQKLAVLQFVARLGGLGAEERRSDVPGGGGGTGNFQVKIFLGGSGSQPMVIEGQSEPVAPSVLTVD
jgi:hypothetical protein